MKPTPVFTDLARALTGLLGLGCLLATTAPGSAAETVRLSSLDLSHVRQGYGKAQVDRSIRETPLTIAGHTYSHGVGTHARSVMWIQLDGGSERFTASVGVDDAAGSPGTVTFTALGDGKRLFESGVMKLGQPAQQVDLDLTGVKTLLLLVEDARDGIAYDHADWAEASFLVSGAPPKTIAAPVEAAVLLTPKPGPAPKINGPVVYGCRPGHPFLYRIPATGERPLKFSAQGLPAGLTLAADTGIITGDAPARGTFKVLLTAENKRGAAQREWTIISGDKLALTPPMGWHHWYAHYDTVTDRLMRQAADKMVACGMADVGYQYVNIDDCWMNAAKNRDPLRVGPLRDENQVLIPNRHFPDMQALSSYLHAQGLKAGIYISPGPRTCAGFAGSYGHEALDARTFSNWGFDFLKYDWCSYAEIAARDKSLDALQKPYRQMGDLLKQQPRDVVFNLCQYGMGEVWKWGEAVGGHCWRTADDLGFELDRIFEVALRNAAHREYSRPGAWNDPDYLQIGMVGNAANQSEPTPCPLTPNEQYAFMSLWCLMASPLIYSGDMRSLDEFTLNILCNPEVIEVDQDPLGQSAEVITLTPDTFLMVKTMADGSKAVGLCNRGEFSARISAPWSAVGVHGQQRVRDLWRQQNLGHFERQYEAEVPRHAVTLLRLWPVK
jgi:alpha-galactosidase